MEQTKEQQQAAFLKAIEENTAGMDLVSPGLSCLCPDCRRAYDYDTIAGFERAIQSQAAIDEGSFSHAACDTCGSKLGGNRYAAHAYIMLDGKSDLDVGPYHFDICVDCLQYFANGTLPASWR